MAHYFTFQVTSVVSEGVNNVIKSLKRTAFGHMTVPKEVSKVVPE